MQTTVRTTIRVRKDLLDQIVLAEYLQIPLYTADEKLVKKASSSLVKVLDDY